MRRVLGLLLASLLVSAVWSGPASAAAGYSMQTTAHYVVDAAAGRVKVTVTVDFKNTTPDTAGHMSVFDRIELPVQDGAAKPAASDSKGALPVAIAAHDGLTVASVVPRTRVRFGQQSRFTLTYSLADQAASDLHVRPEVVQFAAWGFGTASAVTIDLPPTLVVSSTGSPLATDAGPVRIRLTSGPIVDPTQWLARLTATSPVTFTTISRQVTLASATVDLQVRAWTTDQAWGDRVMAIASQVLPRLEAEAGLPYPRVGPLVLIESVPVADATEADASPAGEIQVSYAASDFTVIHQLAHLWASPQLAAERWLQEGLASHLAERVAGVLAIELPYAPATRVTALASEAFPLEQWSAAAAPAVSDAYGYAASWALLDRFAQTVGEANLHLALVRAATGLSAYDPATPGAAGTGSVVEPVDARRLLDQLSELSGTDLGDLFAAQVFGPDAAVELHQRAVARLAYRSLLTQAGGWGAPEAIRTAMATWAFDAAVPQLTAARTWLADRDQFLRALGDIGLAPPQRLRDRYESDGGGPGARAELDAERAVVDALTAAADRVKAPGGTLAQIGLFASDDGPRMLAEARARFSTGDLRTASDLIAGVEHRLDGAVADGLVRIGAAALALLVAAALLVLRARRARRTHYTAAQ